MYSQVPVTYISAAFQRGAPALSLCILSYLYPSNNCRCPPGSFSGAFEIEGAVAL